MMMEVEWLLRPYTYGISSTHSSQQLLLLPCVSWNNSLPFHYLLVVLLSELPCLKVSFTFAVQLID